MVVMVVVVVRTAGGERWEVMDEGAEWTEGEDVVRWFRVGRRFY